jgi:biopolymer transport protein ExbB/TolQ
VAMSAYYLKQVVKDWSLATIYKGMFEFMILQVIAIALIVIFPAIATKFPEQLQAESRAVKTEEVDDSQNRLEEDPAKAMQEKSEDDAEGREDTEEEKGDALEKDELKAKPAAKK